MANAAAKLRDGVKISRKRRRSRCRAGAAAGVTTACSCGRARAATRIRSRSSAGGSAAARSAPVPRRSRAPRRTRRGTTRSSPGGRRRPRRRPGRARRARAAETSTSSSSWVWEPRVHAVSVCPVLGQEIAQARERGVRARLDGAERLAQAVGQLGLRQPVEVGQREHLALRRRQKVERDVDAPPLDASSTVRGTSSAATVSGSSAVGCAGRASSRRTRSTALWCTSDRSHVEAFARATSNRAAPRQTARNPSCTASSASEESRTIRRANP